MNVDSSDILEILKQEEEIFWNSKYYKTFKDANRITKYTYGDIEDVEERYQRFAPFIRIAFPETEEAQGIIESAMTPLDNFQNRLDEKYEHNLEGKLFLKRDDQLPISGTIKARGAIYEVLKHAETLALENGLLKNTDEDYSIFASEEFRTFFSDYNITVGTTGNLGISVGYMARKLGFQVTVHMSSDARDWKKEYLRARGVDVIEHKTNFTKAVEQGRLESERDPQSYFVDDEHSEDLFFGYTAGGYRMKKQVEEYGIQVDEDHPLFVYLPCGIGGSPSGITFGLKHAFGDNVHCFFAEPTKMPSLLIGLLTSEFDHISVEDIELGGKTVADGLAVPRTSGIISKHIRHFFSGGYTLREESFKRLLYALYETEDIFLEPAAVAGLIGPYALQMTDTGKEYIEKRQLTDQLKNATHIAWATGGSMVPDSDREEFISDGKDASLPDIMDIE